MKGYNNFGVMLDCSRNGVMNLKAIKRFIDIISKMGYDTLMLYTEDTFEVENEPYFGYLRGRYTKKELQEADNYAKEKSVELIPCIQTLAHFNHIVRWKRFREITDVNDILLIDSEETYEFLDKIFKSISESFTSRKINIGMDEAHMVGLGKYLDMHGYVNREKLLLKHLDRVNAIAKKYNFEPIMWSDMFYRLAAKGEYYQKDIHISDEVRALVPENISLAYWDYYHKNKEHYDMMIKSHQQFDNDIWFAGGAWSWNGFAPLNEYSLLTMKPAMQSVTENKVKNVLITMWGDNGKECSFFALLPSLYAISEYAKGNFNDKKISEGFYNLTNMSFKDFMLLDVPNKRKINAITENNENPCKSMFYCDYFMGLFDDVVFSAGKINYSLYAKKLKKFSDNKDYGYIFESLSKLCNVLDIKYDLGVRTREAYLSNDKESLKIIVKDYTTVLKRIEKYYQAFKNAWDIDNKPFGFETHEVRFGGLMLRTKSCQKKLNDYIEGKIDSIPELEEKIIPTSECDNFYLNVYTKNVSVCIN
jgi:hypothetical protein